MSRIAQGKLHLKAQEVDLRLLLQRMRRPLFSHRGEQVIYDDRGRRRGAAGVLVGP